MPEIEFTDGTSVPRAAQKLATEASRHLQIYTGEFNGTLMVAHPGDSAEAVEATYRRKSAAREKAYRNSPEFARAAQEAEDRKNACQAAIDELMQQFKRLDYSNLDELVQFFDDMTDPSDHIDVVVPSKLIIETFAQHGFHPNMNCDDEFDGENRENYAQYLIGQALDGLSSVGAIHGVYHKFAAEWRDKFAAN